MGVPRASYTIFVFLGMLLLTLQFTASSFPVPPASSSVPKGRFPSDPIPVTSRVIRQGDASEEEDDDLSTGKRVTFVVLHIVGVICASLAAGSRDYYASTIRHEMFLTVCFYILTFIVLADAIYLTYEFQSPDMLLLGAAIGAVVFGWEVPRLWTISARGMHNRAPMWRTRRDYLYKRVRRELTNDEKANRARSALDWHGAAYKSTLSDGNEILLVREEDPLHWARRESDWRNRMRKARLGNMAARRARGVTGAEVAHVWNMDQRDLSVQESLSRNTDTTTVLCEHRRDLAILIHFKMLLNGPERRESGNDWQRYAADWLFGEMLLSEKVPLENTLAHGKISNDGEVYWNLRRESESRNVNGVGGSDTQTMGTESSGVGAGGEGTDSV